jgi:cell division protein FtsW (lipid II flippase)
MLMAGTYVLTFMVLTLQARKNMPAAFYTSLALGAAIFAAFACAVLTHPHVQARLESMLYGTSYTVQATKAVIHSSSLIGSNPESIQALTNLPEVHTDFIFAGIIGKMGLLMGGLVLLLYVWTSAAILKTTHNTSQFRKLLGFGVFAVFVLNFFGNIDTSIGGLQHASYLPFMSCRWNALLSFCLMFGFLLAKPEKK